MAHARGARLGPYEIVAPLGSGGMGDVYKARDTRLERFVAIKVLREHFATDPDRRARFDREARAISKLNHPNICTLFDVGHDNGVDYLVVELIEGQTLAQRLTKGALPIHQALAIAIDIAAALDAAHHADIVHRDLKPANVMLTKTGAKLLDFGIAREVRGEAVTASITRGTLTADGTLLGTVQYMSPEQLAGETADARSDLFAFGAVVYEMLTGTRAFPGDNQSSIVAAILEREPVRLTTLEPRVSPSLEHTIIKCLAKNAEDRWQTARDMLDELKWSASLPASAAIQTRSRVNVRIGWWIAVVILIAVSGGAAGLLLRAPATDTPVYRSTFVPPANISNVGGLALSPDGQRLAFTAPDTSGQYVLWVRPLDGLAAQALTGTEGAARPFWSPDSRFIAFDDGVHLKKIDVSGGPIITLADGVGPGTWSRDDVILFTKVTSSSGQIARVAGSGGVVSIVTTLDTAAGEQIHGYPSFLPDGRHFLFTTYGAVERTSVFVAGQATVYVGSLGSTERTPLFRSMTNPRYAQGHLIFARGTTLLAQPFDLRGLRLTGEAKPIAEQVWTRSPAQPVAAFSISDNGVLVLQARSSSIDTSRFVWFDRQGRKLAGHDDEAISNSLPDISLSPDGRRAAAVIAVSNVQPDIWIFDLARGVRTRLTFDSAGASAPVWSRDGNTIAFRSLRNGHQDLYKKAADGAGTDEVLLSDNFSKYPESWSPDGRYLLYHNTGPLPAVYDLWVLPLFGDRKPFPFTQSPFNERRSQFSPDGRWVAYQSNESGRWEVFVVPFPGPGGKWQVSTAGGSQARWRHDGKELFYLSGNNTLMAVPVTSSGNRFEAGAPAPLFEVQLPRGATNNEVYDVSPDGQRFLVNIVDKPQPMSVNPLTVVVNWPGLLPH